MSGTKSGSYLVRSLPASRDSTSAAAPRCPSCANCCKARDQFFRTAPLGAFEIDEFAEGTVDIA